MRMLDRPKVIYVLGTGHCGSTLLDLLLNGHSEILGMGEWDRLAAMSPLTRRSAGEAFFASPEWEGVLEAHPDHELQLPKDPARWRGAHQWSAGRVANWAERTKEFLSCLAEASGATFITDASKNPIRLYLYARSGAFDLKVIELRRDGRAVFNSYYRKYGSRRLALQRWMLPTIRARQLLWKYPELAPLTVRYEELTDRPEVELRSICQFLGVEYEPEMMRFREHRYLGVGGNRMKTGTSQAVRKDSLWMEQLGVRERLYFGLVGGALNRWMGYLAFARFRAEAYMSSSSRSD